MKDIVWHLNTEEPESPGFYIVTEEDSYCDTYVWQTNAAYWDGNFWHHDGVFAWAYPPAPFMPLDDDMEKVMRKQILKNCELKYFYDKGIETLKECQNTEEPF